MAAQTTIKVDAVQYQELQMFLAWMGGTMTIQEFGQWLVAFRGWDRVTMKNYIDKGDYVLQVEMARTLGMVFA